MFKWLKKAISPPPEIVYVPVPQDAQPKTDGGVLLKVATDSVRQMRLDLGAKRIYLHESSYGDQRISISMDFKSDMHSLNAIVHTVIKYFGLTDVEPKFRGYGSSISIDIKIPGLHIEIEN